MKRNLHVADNLFQLNVNDPAYGRAFKVLPLLDKVKEKFRKIPKEEILSADEQIVPSKGRSIMKQHMPNKLNRWGYKMFALAGGESSICYDFVFYIGKGDKTEHRFCTKIITDLCETVLRSVNHKLFCDSFYTTILTAGGINQIRDLLCWFDQIEPTPRFINERRRRIITRGSRRNGSPCGRSRWCSAMRDAVV